MIKRLKKTLKQRVVVLTNYLTRQVRQMCEAAGADAFFDKSTELDEFTQYGLGCPFLENTANSSRNSGRKASEGFNLHISPIGVGSPARRRVVTGIRRQTTTGTANAELYRRNWNKQD